MKLMSIYFNLLYNNNFIVSCLQYALHSTDSLQMKRPFNPLVFRKFCSKTFVQNYNYHTLVQLK